MRLERHVGFPRRLGGFIDRGDAWLDPLRLPRLRCDSEETHCLPDSALSGDHPDQHVVTPDNAGFGIETRDGRAVDVRREWAKCPKGLDCPSGKTTLAPQANEGLNGARQGLALPLECCLTDEAEDGVVGHGGVEEEIAHAARRALPHSGDAGQCTKVVLVRLDVHWYLQVPSLMKLSREIQGSHTTGGSQWYHAKQSLAL